MGQDREDGRVIQADSPAEAAKRWAAWQDASHAADYAIAGKRAQPEVCIQAEGSDVVFHFIVSGFMSPTYLAQFKVSWNSGG
ncbi:hypothetical protein B1757_02715 [Acidithiobacillus marinus]|uniref:Uncharacterized protein n=1 Tax=Acidithiobacillus marinus TaxID=187490 RepID=A0A2I1DPE3_9PROT|nr:hypothetical protein [Acidithiobacillus marinus]PKY11719.1 hypothetical protein B1757_02715 [Acidithiobacillus marinus]